MKSGLTTKTLAILCILFTLSGCQSLYSESPRQRLKQLDSGPSTMMTIVNKSGSNIEFFKGSLSGLILAPREIYITPLTLGYQKHSWSHVLLYKNKIKHYSSKIIVTHKSKTLEILPPLQDDMFGYRGQGILKLKDY